ncbi:hypothetical protein [Deinococcus sp.]|uniref:hypothetical protein n=1 Tax=Deinococcus sp. TaxID=47478 RepID=UPI003C7D748E
MTNLPLPVPVPRTSRRRLVLESYLGFALFALLTMVLPPLFRAQGWPNFLVPVAVLPLAIMVIRCSYRLLQPQRLGIADGADAMLDERQLLLRGRAYLNAYRVLGLLIMLGLLYISLAADQGWPMPHGYPAWNLLYMAALLLSLTLPSALLAWTEPDPPAD